MCTSQALDVCFASRRCERTLFVTVENRLARVYLVFISTHSNTACPYRLCSSKWHAAPLRNPLHFEISRICGPELDLTTEVAWLYDVGTRDHDTRGCHPNFCSDRNICLATHHAHHACLDNEKRWSPPQTLQRGKKHR